MAQAAWKRTALVRTFAAPSRKRKSSICVKRDRERSPSVHAVQEGPTHFDAASGDGMVDLIFKIVELMTQKILISFIAILNAHSL